jgi:hypothetical protein
MTAHASFPSESWIAEVHRLMTDIGREYSVADASRQRQLAGTVVAQLSLALTDLGVFDGEARLAQDALEQILLMFTDLKHGRRHVWAVPTNIGGTRIEQAADREVRLWAIIAAELLERSGVKPEEAYRQVAFKLKAANHKFASAKKWHTSYKKEQRPADVERVESALADRQSQFVDPAESARAFLLDPAGILSWRVKQS